MRRVITAGLVALTLAGSVFAQDYFQFQRRFQRSAKFATPESFDGAFNFCRLFYTSVRSEYGGQGWWTDYPDADTNFMIRLSELTKTRVSQDPDGTPNHVVVRADSPELFNCAFVTIEDAGTARFTRGRTYPPGPRLPRLVPASLLNETASPVRAARPGLARSDRAACRDG